MPRSGTLRTYRCPPDHRHGQSSTCYSGHGCGCEECVSRARNQRRKERRNAAYGRESDYYVPAGPTLAKIKQLRDAGWTCPQIADATGRFDKAYIARFLSDPPLRVRPATERTLLAVDAYGLKPSGYVDGTGTRRRLQALARMGYAPIDLGERLGMQRENVRRAMAAGGMVHVSTRDSVAVLYEELWATPAPAGYRRSRAIAGAARHGWSGPLDWDDIDNDPEPVAPVKSNPGETRGVRVLENAEWLLNSGETPEIIVGTLGRTAGSLAKLARFHNRPDIATHFYALDKHERTAA